VDLKEAGKWLTGLELERAARRGLLSAAMRGVAEIVTFIIPSRSPQPVDRGLYRAGWKATKTKAGAAIENSEPQAVWIEEGVRPRLGPAAFAALTEWVVRKGLAQPHNAMDVAARVIHAMRRRGSIFGTRGMGILRELNNGKIQVFIQEEVDRELRRAILKNARRK
jgi:hypothetical protein